MDVVITISASIYVNCVYKLAIDLIDMTGKFENILFNTEYRKIYQIEI